MTLFHKIRIEFTLLLICAVLLMIEQKDMFFGKIINNYFPCVQSTEIVNSLPCYAKYDILILVNALVVSGVVTAILVYKVVRHSLKK